MEANPASPEASQKTNIEDLSAEIAKTGTTLNGVAKDASIMKFDTAELKNTVSAIQKKRQRVALLRRRTAPLIWLTKTRDWQTE